jgi:hypothetical protein
MHQRINAIRPGRVDMAGDASGLDKFIKSPIRSKPVFTATVKQSNMKVDVDWGGGSNPGLSVY